MAKLLKENFLDRLKLSASQNSSLEFMPDWLCENTQHPMRVSKPWSFDEHEFQIDIVKSTSHKQSIKKCSQVGLSEVAARKALALAALRQGTQIIYTLPTGAFASMFAKTRVDTIIENSPTMSAMIDKDTNNSKLKRLGSSFIHFVGTYSASSPISIPASYVISDEVDFSDQSVLTEFNSRLGHQKESESANIKFSTPTVEGYSISADFELSSQARYAVNCTSCNTWVIPEFLKDVIIPGNDIPIVDLTRYDIASIGDKVDHSYLSCPKCRKDLAPSLLNKDRRAWVHAYPDKRKDHEGFQVVPYDVYAVNPIKRTLKQLLDYKRVASWYNFKLGQTYSDDTTKFNIQTVKNNTVVTNTTGVTGAVIGCDVGKISWVSVGVPFTNSTTGDVEQLDVIDLIRIDTTKLPAGSTLGQEIVKIANKYFASVVIVDAAPDFTTAQHVHKLYLTGQAYGNYYVNETTFAKDMTHWKIDDRKGVCLSARTSSLDDLCDNINSGRVKFPVNKNMDDVMNHLDALKRIEDEGGREARWVKRDKAEDHWAHALNYLAIAAQIATGSGMASIFEIIPSISAVGMKAGKRMKF